MPLSRRLRTRAALPSTELRIPFFVDAATYQITSGGGGSSNTTVNKPTLALPGDLLVAITTTRYAVSSITPPAGWNLIQFFVSAGSPSPANNTSWCAYWRTLQTGDPASWTATMSPSAENGTGVVAIRGASATAPIAGISTNTGFNSSIVHNSVDVPAVSSLLLGAWGVGANSSSTVPSGTVQRYLMPDGANIRTCGAGWTKPAVGTGPSGSFTASSPLSGATNGYSAGIIVISPP